MTKLFDGTFPFDGLHGCPSRCHLRIYRHPDRPVVVVATELTENRGTSITNALPDLAKRVCSAFDIDPYTLLWVEHYPAEPPCPETLERVEFAGGREPAWEAMSRSRLEVLTGEPLGHHRRSR
jgi:hypothetical protein